MSFHEKYVKKAMNTLRDVIGFSGRNRKKKLDKALKASDPSNKPRQRTLRNQELFMRTPKKVPNQQAKKKAALKKHTIGLKQLINAPVRKKSLRD